MNDSDDLESRAKPNEPVHDVSKTINAPRKIHGTRVAITFVCSGCGTESQLDYKPRGVSLTELLCEECMNAKEGSERWKLVRDKKRDETRSSRQFKVTCTECGTRDSVSRRPKGGWMCDRCKMDQAQPDPTRLDDMEPVDDSDSPIFVRRKKSE